MLKEFGDAASRLARNPLGIIALFQVLIYGIAGLVTATIGPTNTAAFLPLIWFLVLFPVVVIAVFTYLVVCHHNKLYAPSDFADESNFMLGLPQDRRYTAEELIKAEAEGTVLPTGEEES